jgi:hypothetical protein
LTFDHHAFISYAIIDNKPLSPEQEGWVTRFHATFEALLSMRIGESARIWRDAKLQGNDSLSGEIFDRIGRTALLVTVLTPLSRIRLVYARAHGVLRPGRSQRRRRAAE